MVETKPAEGQAGRPLRSFALLSSAATLPFGFLLRLFPALLLQLLGLKEDVVGVFIFLLPPAALAAEKCPVLLFNLMHHLDQLEGDVGPGLLDHDAENVGEVRPEEAHLFQHVEVGEDLLEAPIQSVESLVDGELLGVGLQGEAPPALGGALPATSDPGKG